MVALPLALVGGGVAFLLLPRVIEGRRTLADAREQFFKTTEDIRGLEALRQGLNRIDREALRQLFVPSGRPLGFIEALENLASRSGSALEIVFLEPAAAAAPASRARSDEGDGAEAEELNQPGSAPEKTVRAAAERGFELRLKGSFRGALQFINALERQGVLLRVDAVASQPVQERGQAAPKVITTIRLYAPVVR